MDSQSGMFGSWVDLDTGMKVSAKLFGFSYITWYVHLDSPTEKTALLQYLMFWAGEKLFNSYINLGLVLFLFALEMKIHICVRKYYQVQMIKYIVSTIIT